MSRIRTLFLGTPDFARHCLEGLIRDDHFEVVGVVTQPDRPSGRQLKLTPSPVKTLVQPLGIPVLCPEKINQAETLAAIASFRAEVAIVVAYGQIMGQDFLNLFPGKTVNIHTSLLPRWRGAAPIQRALMAGDVETGVSLQVMVRKLDAGGVLGCRKISLTSQMNAMTLHESLKPLASELLAVDLMDYLRGNLSPVAQDEAKVTYAEKINKSEAQIHWTQTAEHISNLVRGLAMGPFATCGWGKSFLKIHRTEVTTEADGSRVTPGTILHLNHDFFVVSCGQHALKVFEVQPESRPRMSVSQFLAGHNLKAGEVLA
ncbi:MAG: methionyl-tRNA formyltransferase [Bdellovibrionales bacterium]|nr:methionyl-tRNA formyltransferase [Bdellovibrionales bacterium]